MAKSKGKSLVYLVWIDSVSPSESGWMCPDDLDDFAEDEFLIEDVGFIHAENKKYICLVGGRGMNKDTLPISHRIVMIPKVAIKKRIDLSRHIK
jgi:hypothetical protein